MKQNFTSDKNGLEKHRIAFINNQIKHIHVNHVLQWVVAPLKIKAEKYVLHSICFVFAI